VSYTTDNTSVAAYWSNFTDGESGISTYDVSLWRYVSCAENSATTVVTDWITLSSNNTFYEFVDQSLEVKILIRVNIECSTCFCIEL
jgi:hypothetical protein